MRSEYMVVQRFGHELGLSDFLDFPVWVRDCDTGLFSPAKDLAVSVEGLDDFFFKAVFEAPDGTEVQGAILGLGKRVVMLGVEGESCFLNGLLYEDSLEALKGIVLKLGSSKINTPNDLLPLKFKTDIKLEPFEDWEGEFALSEI